MSKGLIEITNIVERLELLEEKFGIAISGLYADRGTARINGVEGFVYIRINFDLTSNKLESDVWMIASAYNSAGQLLDTHSDVIYAKDFNGFISVSMSLSNLNQIPARIRLFPSASWR